MYGKAFESMYSGSMVGSGVHVFAVWNYVIAKMRMGIIEINPKMLAFILGGKEEEVESALKFLCSPDPNSRSKLEDGRRLVREGQFQFRVVNWEYYESIKNENDRREYNRTKQKEYRLRKKLKMETPSEQPVELPEGFPKTAEEAVQMSGMCGADPVFVSTLWNSAMAQGGITGNGRPITSWQHYVAKHWPGEQAKRAQARASGKPDPTKTIEDVVRRDTNREITMKLKQLERLDDESRL